LKFVFITKTRWDENPRVRHQLARMLSKRGHQVIFVERGNPFSYKGLRVAEENILVCRPLEPIHHQLRIFRWLQVLSNYLYSLSLHYIFKNTDLSEFIFINFNYEADFISKIYSKNTFVTYLIDDWVAQAKLCDGRHVSYQQDLTVSQSDVLLCVSEPIRRQFPTHDNNHLFLPWHEGIQTDEIKSDTSDGIQLFFWGVIDYRLDFLLIKKLALKAPAFTIHLIGPVDKRQTKHVTNLLNHNNIILHDPMPLSELRKMNLHVSIIPYVSGVKDIEAVTASNKTFRLLSAGWPIITTGMPHFYSSKVTVKAASDEEIVSYAKSFYKNAESFFDEAKLEASKHTEENRYSFFTDTISKFLESPK